MPIDNTTDAGSPNPNHYVDTSHAYPVFISVVVISVVISVIYLSVKYKPWQK